MVPVNRYSVPVHRVAILGVSSNFIYGGMNAWLTFLKDNRISASIINALTATHNFDIHQVVSAQSSAKDSHHVTVHQSNLTSDSLHTLFSTIKPDILISTISSGSFDTQKLIIDAAIDSGIKRFIPPEFGHDSLNPNIQNRLPPLREKARTIAYLRDAADSKRISWVAVATGCILDHGLQSGNLGFDLKWQSATMHGTGEERFAASSAAWVGQAVLRVLKQWDDVANRYLYVSGTVTSGNDVLKSLEQATGQRWEAGRGDVVECVQEAERRIDRGFPDAGMFLMERSVLYDERLDATRPFVDEDAKGLLGLQPERLEDIVKNVLHEHKHHGKADCGCE